MNYWVVPIIIGNSERFWEIAGALFSYLLSQYGSWIGDWGTVTDAFTLLENFQRLPITPKF